VEPGPGDTRDVQLTKLHGVVGQAILTHLYNSPLRLPNKGTALDGHSVRATMKMRDHYAPIMRSRLLFATATRVPAVRAVQVLGVIAARRLAWRSVPAGGVQIGLRPGRLGPEPLCGSTAHKRVG